MFHNLYCRHDVVAQEILIAVREQSLQQFDLVSSTGSYCTTYSASRSCNAFIVEVHSS